MAVGGENTNRIFVGFTEKPFSLFEPTPCFRLTRQRKVRRS